MYERQVQKKERERQREKERKGEEGARKKRLEEQRCSGLHLRDSA